MQFYSYLWLREDWTPYYAGKGSKNRAFERHAGFYAPKDRMRILIFPKASEAEAFASEVALIAAFGRKDLGTGCLRNLTDGGENPPRTKKGRKFSEETLRQMEAAAKGKPKSTEHRRKISEGQMGCSRTWSADAKQRRRGEHNPMFGKHHSEEARRKIGEASKRRQFGKAA